MDYTVLKTLLTGENGSGSAQEVAERLNGKTVLSAVGRKRKVSDVWLQLAKRNLLAGIKKASENEGHAAHGVAYAVMAFLTGPVEEMDVKDGASQALMGALVAAGLIGATDKAEITKLSDDYISPAEAAGITEQVEYWDVERARAL
jgi:hypothetical protein